MIKLTLIEKLTTKVISWPLWSYVAICIIAAICFLFPPHIYSPGIVKAWALFIFIISLVLSIAKSVNLYVENQKIQKTFQLTPVELECYCYLSEQKDKRIATQLHYRFDVKNITKNDIGLVCVKLLKPFIPGEIISSDVRVRHRDSNEYGSARNGYLIPANTLLPMVIVIMILGDERIKFEKIFQSKLLVIDDQHNTQKIKVAIKLRN